MKKIQNNKIYWITGQSGSGKTKLAYALQKEIGGIILDGDEMRESISLDAGFSKEDRESHNLRVSRLALVLARQSIVIVSVIAPFESTRIKINKIIEPVWIYVSRDIPKDPNKPYEIPKDPHITVYSDLEEIDEKIKKIVNYIKSS